MVVIPVAVPTVTRERTRWDKMYLLILKIKTMKKNVWDKILKVVIAVASAILGALGANAMNV